jgi:hypothetical protein
MTTIKKFLLLLQLKFDIYLLSRQIKKSEKKLFYIITK